MAEAEALPLLPLAVTGVGSLPHRDLAAALRFVARTAPLVPYRPELVQRGDGMGGVARGREAFVRALREGLFPEARIAKGQVCGPLTLGRIREASVSDVFPDVLREAVAEARALVSTGLPALVVVDEPCLREPGDRSATVAALRALFAALRAEGAVPGLHCCDRMDLTLLLELGPAVWSFDAHAGLETALEDSSVQQWLSEGGRPILGLVPTRGRFDGLAERLARVPAPVRARSLLSASCGLGTLRPDRARRVAAELRRLAR